MPSIKKVLQHDETDCGAACISIILQYYGKTVPLRKIRSAAGTDSVGTSGFGIVKGAEKFGLSCKGLMSLNKDKIEDIPFPAIFHIKEHLDHYVVVYKVNRKFVFISDPAVGLRKIKRGDFFNWWTGVFFIYHTTVTETGYIQVAKPIIQIIYFRGSHETETKFSVGTAGDDMPFCRRKNTQTAAV